MDGSSEQDQKTHCMPIHNVHLVNILISVIVGVLWTRKLVIFTNKAFPKVDGLKPHYSLYLQASVMGSSIICAIVSICGSICRVKSTFATVFMLFACIKVVFDAFILIIAHVMEGKETLVQLRDVCLLSLLYGVYALILNVYICGQNGIESSYESVDGKV